MAEYIEKADALNVNFRISVNIFESRRKTAEAAVQAYADEIAKIPSADVRPVVRGKWEYTVIEGDVISEIPTVVKGVCSVCHNYSEEIPKWIYDDGGCIWFNFCPHLRG